MRRSMVAWLVGGGLGVVACSGGGSASNPGGDGGVARDGAIEDGSLGDGPSRDAAGEASGPCDDSQGTTLSGQLGGAPVSQSFSADSSGNGSSSDPTQMPSFSIWTSLGSDGLLYGIGNGSAQAATLQAGALVLPTEAATDPGGLYCVEAGTISQVPSSSVVAWSLTALSRAGACPSTGAAQGDWTGCIADSFWTPDEGGADDGGTGGAPCVAGQVHLVGTLQGAPFDWTIPEGNLGGGGSAAGTNVTSWLAGIGDVGFVVLEGAGADAAPGAVVGTLRLPTTVSAPGAFFCIPPESTAVVTEHALLFTLRGVVSAGSCGSTAAGAHLEACSG